MYYILCCMCVCVSPFCHSFQWVYGFHCICFLRFLFVAWLSRDILVENVWNRFFCCCCCCCCYFLFLFPLVVSVQSTSFFLSFFETVCAGASMSETQIGIHVKHSMRRGECICILLQQKKDIFNNGAICFGSFASIVLLLCCIFFHNHQIAVRKSSTTVLTRKKYSFFLLFKFKLFLCAKCIP